jgi:ABC-type transport system substrate-binding protein
MFMLRPMYEPLIGVDRNTGELEPQLASNWEAATDGRSWDLDLQQDVPWHFGFGEFTAADVVHSFERVTAEDSVATDKSTWVSRVGTGENINVVNSHKVIFNLQVVDPQLWFNFATRSGNMLMISKSQWDAEGEEGMIKKPTGTGSYQYVDRVVGQFILFDRVENHWRKTPEFKQLIIQVVPEPSTRLAMILTGEAHFTDLPREIHDTALDGGMQRVSALLPGTSWMYLWGGLYFTHPGLLEGLPVEDVRVREAMNRAIDRQELIETIMAGRAEMATHHGYHPTRQGFNPAWLTDFEANYGYDPAKARQLLADAGYPDGFDIQIYDYPYGGFPEINQINEAFCQYFIAVGIGCTLNSVDYAVARPELMNRTLHGSMMGFPPFAAYPPHNITYLMKDSRAAFPSYNHPFIDQQFDKLFEADPAGWDAIVESIGQHIYDEYAIIPLFFSRAEVILDPKVIGEFKTPGVYSDQYTHLEYIKAAQ